MSSLVAVVLAAGKGTRMKSDIPKVLHCIDKIPMLKIVINTIKKAGVKKIFVVIGYNSELVKTSLSKATGVEFLEQKEQLGTAHAVLQAENKLKNYKGQIFVINGDSPLVKAESIKKLIDEHKLYKPAATILTAFFLDNPYGYGRIMRKNNLIDKIVEDKNASKGEKKIKEINVGVYCFDSKYLFSNLKKVKIDNSKKEMYLTDVIKIFRNKNLEVRSVSSDSEEAIGIDTQEKLIEASKILKKREKWKN